MGIAELITRIIILCILGGLVIWTAYFFISVYRILPELQKICGTPIVEQCKVPFFTEDDRTVSKHDTFEEPRMLDYTKLTVRRYDDGYVVVELDDQTLLMMGEGPFKILLAAARKRAIIKFEDVWNQETPYLVRRFFDMLQRDLKMITDPVFYRAWDRCLTIVGGMTDQPRVSAMKAQHQANNERRRQERLDILAGRCHPYTSPVDDRMVDAEWRRRHGILLSDVTP